jgi:hypothetical protein
MSTRCALERSRWRELCAWFTGCWGLSPLHPWAYFGPLFRVRSMTGHPSIDSSGGRRGFALFGMWLRNRASQLEPLDEIQMGSLADKAEANPRIAAFLRERIETHGELARRDYEAAWTMYESGLRSKAEIDAVKGKRTRPRSGFRRH